MCRANLLLMCLAATSTFADDTDCRTSWDGTLYGASEFDLGQLQ